MSLQAVKLLSRPIQWAQANPKTAGASTCFVVIFAIYAYRESTKPEALSYRKVQASCYEFFQLNAFYQSGKHLFVERREPNEKAHTTASLLEKITAIEALLGAIEAVAPDEESEMKTLYTRIFQQAPVSLRGSPLLFLEMKVWNRAFDAQTVEKDPFIARVFEHEDTHEGEKVEVQEFKFLNHLEKFRYALAHYKALLTYVKAMTLGQYEEYLLLALRVQIHTLRNHIGECSKKHYGTGAFLTDMPELKLENLQGIMRHLQTCEDLDQEKIKDVLNDLQFIQFAYQHRATHRYLVGDVGLVFFHQAFQELKSIQKGFMYFLTQFSQVISLFFMIKSLVSNVIPNFSKSSA